VNNPDGQESHFSPDVTYRGKPSATPLVEATAFARESPEELEAIFAGREFGHLYSRLSNPTLAALEQRLTDLEGGIGAATTASGMAAIAATVLTLARAGDSIVTSQELFGGTYSLFSRLLPDYGIESRFLPVRRPKKFSDAIDKNTRMIFVETISNPGLRVADLNALAEIASDYKIPLVVDSTVTTPLLFQPAKEGAGIVIHSTTKFISGHGDAVGGCVVDCGGYSWDKNPHLKENYSEYGELAFLAELRWRGIRTLGANQSPANARLTLRGLKTLGTRIKRHCNNSLRLAKQLRDHPEIKELNYPGLREHPDHELAKKQFNNRYGAILTMKLGTKEKCFKFLNALHLIKNMVNIGDTCSMAIHPASTICRDLDPDEKRAMGVTEDLVRICVGLEDYEELKKEIVEALNKV